MTAHLDLTFPQRIRLAADVLREVAAYRSRTRHGEDGVINEHSSHTPYTASQLDKAASDVEDKDKIAEMKARVQIAEVRARIDYNAHDLGEFGRMIRVEYVGNILDDLARKLGASSVGAAQEEK